MGRKKIEISSFGRQVSAAVRAEMGIGRLSGKELARRIGRGATYVRERVNDNQEWALSDIEAMCRLWNLTPEELINVHSPHRGDDTRLTTQSESESDNIEEPQGYGKSLHRR